MSARSQQTRGRAASSRRGASQRSGSAQTTTDLNEIRAWAEARGGAARLLRIDFSGYTGAGRFQEISWDEWCEKFQESNLEFLYQDRTKSGEQSRFFKLVSRGTSQTQPSHSQGRARSSSKKR